MQEMTAISVVGVGPGDPAYLTAQGIELISTAEVVAGFNLPLETASRHIKGERVLLTYKNQEAELAKLAELARAGRRCVVCAQGDPSFSGHELVERVEAAGAFVEVIPGVSSVQVVCARAGLEMEQVLLFTFHKRGDSEPTLREFLAATRLRERHLIALPRPWDFMPDVMARRLVEEGNPVDRPASVYERLTLPGERVTVTTLGALSAWPEPFSDLSILVVPKA